MTFLSARRYAFLLLIVLASLPAGGTARAASVIFRYLPGQPALSSATVASGVGASRYVVPGHEVARGAGGWGLQAPYAASFSGALSTLRSADTAALSQPFGPQLTAEVWIVASALEGRSVLLSNRISGAGNFELGLDGATPYFIVNTSGGEVRLDGAALEAETALWIAATAFFDVGKQQLQLAIHVNGHAVATSTTAAQFPPRYLIERPFFVGTEATGTADSYTLEGKFSGHLLAATVRDYAVGAPYLYSSVPLDGSAYFGLTAFHDYSLATYSQPMDQRIGVSQVVPSHRFFLPYANDEYVPQGMASHVTAVGSDTTALVYVAYYHLTRGGATGQRRSIVAELDAATGHVRRTFRLMGTLGYSHAGGIAYARGAIFVSSSSKLERYPLPAYEGAGAARYLDLEADAAGTIGVYSRASFVSEYNDTLWVGDWRTPSHNAPYLYGYPLDSEGRPVRGAEPEIYALPRNVQGVEFFEHRGQTYVFLSRNVNMGRGEAEILRVPRGNLKRWIEPQPDSTIKVPYGIEDLSFFPDGTLWTNSESGADRYQKGSGAWTYFYPFVYSLPARTVLGSDVSTGVEERPGLSPTGLHLRAAPNPFGGETTLTLDLPAGTSARLRVMDVLGRHIATLLEGPASAGPQAVRWNAGAHADGLYFVVLETEGRRVVQPVTLVR